MLPIQPKPKKMESTFGYLIRVLSSNKLRTSLTRVFKRIRSVVFCAEALELKGMVPDKTINQLQQTSLCDRVIPREFFTTDDVWLCPECYGDEPYHREYWLLKPFYICPSHRSLLANTCTECGAKFSWRVLVYGKCSCGAKIGRHEHRRLPLGDTALENWYFLDELFHQFDVDKHSGDTAYASVFESIGVQNTLWLLYGLVNFEKIGSATALLKLVQEAGRSQNFVARIEPLEFMRDWPSNFGTALEDLEASAWKPEDAHQKRGHLMRLVFTVLDDQDFKPIRVIFRDYLTHRQIACDPITRGGNKVITCLEASAWLSLPSYYVRELALDGRIKRFREKPDDMVADIDLDSVRELYSRVTNFKQQGEVGREYLTFPAALDCLRASNLKFSDLCSSNVFRDGANIFIDERRIGFDSLNFEAHELFDVLWGKVSDSDLFLPKIAARLVGLKKNEISTITKEAFIRTKYSEVHGQMIAIGELKNFRDRFVRYSWLLIPDKTEFRERLTKAGIEPIGKSKPMQSMGFFHRNQISEFIEKDIDKRT